MAHLDSSSFLSLTFSANSWNSTFLSLVSTCVHMLSVELWYHHTVKCMRARARAPRAHTQKREDAHWTALDNCTKKWIMPEVGIMGFLRRGDHRKRYQSYIWSQSQKKPKEFTKFPCIKLSIMWLLKIIKVLRFESFLKIIIKFKKY